MKQTNDLTISEAKIPAGRSLSESELDQAERALFTLLYDYEEQQLKGDLRQTLNTLTERHPDSFIILNDELMMPAELYRMVDAAEVLVQYLERRIYHRLENRAAAGDQEAAEELRRLG